jgi:hypothetical protein
MDAEIRSTLSELGLSGKEIRVYLTLLSLGSAPASVLGKKTNIVRSTAKYTCEQLRRKKLVSVLTKNGTDWYTVEPPKKIFLLLEEQKHTLEQKTSAAQRILSSLEHLHHPQSTMAKVQFFEGVDGIIEMFDDVLITGETLFGAFRLGANIHLDILNYVKQTYIPKRKELENTAYMLVNENEATTAYRKRDAEMNRITLQMDKERYPFDTCMHIYGKKVAFYSYDEHDLTGVLIQNENIFHTQQALFRMAWELALMQPKNVQYSQIPLPL